MRQLVDTNIADLRAPANQLKTLIFREKEVETKITEIVQHRKRIKIGLIKALGSVFCVKSGNQFATDGEL